MKVLNNKNIVLCLIALIAIGMFSYWLYDKFYSMDYSNPELVLRKYREYSDKNTFEKVYDDFLSEDSKKISIKDEFIKIKAKKNNADYKYSDREITQLPLDNNSSSYSRFILKEKVSFKNKPTQILFYYTLKNENGKWKVIWTDKLLLFGDEQIAKGNYSDAIVTNEKIVELNPYSASAFRRIADCYGRLKNIDEYLKYCKIAVALEPENIDVYNSIGGYYGMIGNPEMEIEYFKRAIGHCLNESNKSNFYSNISATYFGVNDLGNATINAKLAIQSDSAETFAWFMLAKIKQTQNDLLMAKSCYKKAISLHKMEASFQADLYGNYVNCLLHFNECDSAIKYSQKALDLLPESKPLQEVNERAMKCK